MNCCVLPCLAVSCGVLVAAAAAGLPPVADMDASEQNVEVRDSYVGDIGDFGKYGLLRALAGEDLWLGVVWYLNGDPEKAKRAKKDGGLTGYAKAARDVDRRCDSDLFVAMAGLVDDRRVAAVRERGTLPARTLFYEAPLEFLDLPRGAAAKVARADRRRVWCLGALNAVREADVVFLDPDNGLTNREDRALASKGKKYTTTSELLPYLARDQSLIVYHHQTREAPLAQQVERWLGLLREQTGIEPWAFTYHRLQVRIYFVIPAPAHREQLLLRSLEFASGPWCEDGTTRHFKPHNLPSPVASA